MQIFGHIWIVFLTIPIAYNRGSHILMNILLERMPASVQRTVAIAVDIMWLWIGVSIAIFSMRLVRVAVFQRSPALEIPMSYIYMGLVIGGAYLTLVALRKLIIARRRRQRPSCGSDRGPAMTLLILLLVLLALIFIGVPIILCMGVIGLAGMLWLPDVNAALFPQRMFGMLDTYALLALPYFVLAGSLMSHGGLSLHLVRFARTLVGHFRAGLCHASIVASMIFAGVSGSSTADASAISSVVIPTMKQAGYKPGFAAALIACAGTIGAIIPPSMVMVVYGSMAQVSIGGLFLGGIVPGTLVGLFLMIAVKIHSHLAGISRAARDHGKIRSVRGLARA